MIRDPLQSIHTGLRYTWSTFYLVFEAFLEDTFWNSSLAIPILEDTFWNSTLAAPKFPLSLRTFQITCL